MYRIVSIGGGLFVMANILFNASVMKHLGGFNAGRTDLVAARDLVKSPSQRWIDHEISSSNLPNDARFLCVGEAALFFAQFPYVYNTVFDQSLFEEWCMTRDESGNFEPRDSESIREALKQHNITHILVNWSEILRYREPGSYGYTNAAHPDQFARLQQLGILGPPLPLPDNISLSRLSDSRELQIREWKSDSLLVKSGKDPAFIAIQIFPVSRGGTVLKNDLK
ncbi:MAG: hypothetical protein FJ267_14425 [Planctomycetes bacterium]|nr:hypothetical protein [Planctomycetota bacterium]